MAAEGAAPARRSQREATRQRVLLSARALFETEGYDGATVREIARLAGVAVGSVFTAFASKSDILSEVMQARLEPLYAELERVVPSLRDSTADRLRDLFAAHFDFETRNLRLFLVHIAANYDWNLSATAQPYGRNGRLRAFVRDVLVRGVALGEVRGDVDLEDATDLLFGAYAWCCRLAVGNDAEPAAVIAAMDRQIGLVADGLAPRRAD